MSLSGGESKSKSESRAKTATQEKWLNEALGIYGPTLGQGQAIYGGERIAPFGEGQQAALAQAGGYLPSFAPTREMPLFSQTGGTISDLLAGNLGAQPITPQQTESYWSRAIAQPARKQFKEYTIPGIQEAFAGPGFWSSARAKEETEAYQDLGDWLGEQRGGLEWDVLQANRAAQEAQAGRAQAAVPQAMGYGQLPTQEAAARLGGTQGVFGFLGQEQGLRQAQIQSSIQKFAEENQLTDPQNMQILMALLGLNFSTAQAQSSAWNASLGLTAPSPNPTTSPQMMQAAQTANLWGLGY